MPDKITSIDIDKVTQDAAKISGTTDDYDKLFGALQKVLAETDRCWGDDDTGKAFAKQYVPSVVKFIDQVKEGVQDLKKSAVELRSVPEKFEQADNDNGDSVSGSY